MTVTATFRLTTDPVRHRWRPSQWWSPRWRELIEMEVDMMIMNIEIDGIGAIID